MATDDTKYTRVEYERRFLVRADADWRAKAGSAPNRIEDTYLHGTRMRLRVVTDTTTLHRTLKLTKKAGSPSPYFRTIGRILLAHDEHRLLDSLPGDRLTKTRFHVVHLERTFAVDVFDPPLDGLTLCEIEAPSLDDLMRVQPPAFVVCEVTEDAFFSGANLCRIGRHDLLAKLAALGAC